MKNFVSCLFYSIFLLFIMSVPASADEKPVIDEGRQPAISQQTPENNPSPVISTYRPNSVASRAVEKNVGLFSNRIKEKFSLWLSRSGQYIEMMKNILRENDVPEDIVFLSLIESGFNPYAYSIARAAGPWQFIASTARRYGLEINWWKDERRDPIKSTTAAASYLKDLYDMFGSWNLAMAAYNAGEGKIQKALKKSNSDDYWDLLGTRHIKNETKDYVPKFIAASLIAANPKDFGFDDIEYNKPMRYDVVELNSPVDLSVAADCAGVDLDVIKTLNPELRRWCTPPDVPTYKLRIPEGTKEVFLNKLASLSEEERFSIVKYNMKKGETLKQVARRTGVPESAILSLNSMESIKPLRSGSMIYLPPSGKYSQDVGDRAVARKASFKSRKRKHSARKTTLARGNTKTAERPDLKG